MWFGYLMWKLVCVKIGVDVWMLKIYDFFVVIVGIVGFLIFFGFVLFVVIGSSDIGVGVFLGGVGVVLVFLVWFYWFL